MKKLITHSYSSFSFFSFILTEIQDFFEYSIPTNLPKIVIWFLFLQVSLIVYIAAFSLGFGPLPWAMNAELFPVEAKVKATPLITA